MRIGMMSLNWMGEMRIFAESLSWGVQILLWINSEVQRLRVEMYIRKAGPFLVLAFTVLRSGIDLFLRLLSKSWKTHKV